MREILHKRLIEKRGAINAWFEEKSKGLEFPIYCSVDIRDAGGKLASVDANIFPAGFNNICDVDQQGAVALFKNYLSENYGPSFKRIVLLTEEHTNNKYYWDNVSILDGLITQAGYDVRVAVPKQFSGQFAITSAAGREVKVFSAHRDGDHLKLDDGFVPDLIISNNDFSNPYVEWLEGLKTPFNPSYKLGWYKRKKSDHFRYYNDFARQVSDLLDLDPWTFTVETEVAQVDFSDPKSIEELAHKAQSFLDKMSTQYQVASRSCCDPVVFVKNNSGTYGMGILSVKSGKQLLELSAKERKKMGYSKGGAEVHEVIIQEGIPTQVSSDGDTAEPVIYMVGPNLAGGFLRTHREKGPIENLNSPGAVFKRLCMSDLLVDAEGSPQENVYGLIARLNNLAIGMENRTIGAHYHR
ncbi:MAG: glutamate--cysteine ligase [Oligoflexia bacterium]|nr:glutamate--cysteine ligase [Oligoflexia bacterium]